MPGGVRALDLARSPAAPSRSSSSPSPSRPSGTPGCPRSSRAGSPPGSRRSATRGRSPTRARWYASSASQRAMFGALPSRIARRRTGSASPSISRKMIPGTSVRVAPPCAPRDPLDDAQRVRVVVVRPEDDLEDDADGGDDERGEQRPPERVDGERLSSTSPASSSTRASSTSMSRKPRTSVNGSRSAAITGGTTAFNAPTTRATRNAPPAS